jgi:DNA-binding transcriptional regulator YiaG
MLEWTLEPASATGSDARATNAILSKGETNPMASAAINKMKKKLPERLAQVRGDRSQRQFARELGVFQQNVNRYENGTTPHADFLITLALKESVSLDWLLLGTGRMKRSGR